MNNTEIKALLQCMRAIEAVLETKVFRPCGCGSVPYREPPDYCCMHKRLQVALFAANEALEEK
jgi:hypothetical protein